jgi:hypothetical protein
MDPKQLWLFEPEPLPKEANRIALSLSENDCRQLGNMFAELLINFLNKKQEARDADDNR